MWNYSTWLKNESWGNKMKIKVIFRNYHLMEIYYLSREHMRKYRFHREDSGLSLKCVTLSFLYK